MRSYKGFGWDTANWHLHITTLLLTFIKGVSPRHYGLIISFTNQKSFFFSPEHIQSHKQYSIRLSKKQAYEWHTNRKHTKKKHIVIQGYYYCGKCENRRKIIKFWVIQCHTLYTVLTVGKKKAKIFKGEDAIRSRQGEWAQVRDKG